MDTRALEVVSLTKREFDNQWTKPDNVLFFVYEEYVAEDKKAKVRIRLYKGPHLICGDLYEAVLKINKEIEHLKESGGTGGGTSSGTGGAIDIFFKGFPEDIYCGGYTIRRVTLYPENKHDLFSAAPALPSSISQVINNPTPDFHELSPLFLLVEDTHPIDPNVLEENGITLSTCYPYLYRIGYNQTVSVDYKLCNKSLFHVVNGCSPHIKTLSSTEDVFCYYFGLMGFDENDDTFSFPLHPANDFNKEQKGLFYFDKKDVAKGNEGSLYALSDKDSIVGTITFNDYAPTDELDRFHLIIHKENSTPVSKIDFLDERQRVLFTIDQLSYGDTHIDVAPYGIYIYDRENHVRRKGLPSGGIVSTHVKHIRLHSKDFENDRAIRPYFVIGSGSVLDYNASELIV